MFLALFSLSWREGFPGGVPEVGAMRVLAGELPYRDFWTIYAPGQFYLLAGLFAVFGERWLVSPIAASVLLAAAVGVLFAACRRAGAGRAAAIAGGGIVGLAILATSYPSSCGSYPPALLWIAIAWALVAKPGSASHPLLAGCALGAAALFKHDVAGYSAIGIASVQLLRALPMDRGLGHALREPSWTAAGALLVFLPPMAWLAALAGSDLWQDLVVFPLGDFPASRPEVLPLWPAQAFQPGTPLRSAALSVGFSLAFWLPSIAWLPCAWIVRGRAEARAWAAGLFATFLLHQWGAQVQINTHVISWSVLATLALAPTVRHAGVPIRLVVFGLAGLLGTAHAMDPLVRFSVETSGRTAAFPGERGRGSRVYPGDVELFRAAQGWLERAAAPDDRLFVGATRHDALITTPIRRYFLLGRLPAVRYQELHPAVADTAVVQREMIADLERHRPPVILLREMFSDDHLDRWRDNLQTRVPAVGARDLDRYLEQQYETVETIGPDRILLRRDRASELRDAS